MSVRRLTRRTAALVLLAVTLFPSAAAAGTVFRCASDGKARDACCCPSEKTPPPFDLAARMSRTCCCDIEESAPARLTTAPTDTSRIELATIVAQVAHSLPSRGLTELRQQAVELRDDEVRLAVGPPLILKKHSRLL